jgi:hypothetical protein
LLPLVCRSTQTPPQSVCPEGQGVTQVPLTQVWPERRRGRRRRSALVLVLEVGLAAVDCVVVAVAEVARCRSPITQALDAHAAVAFVKLHVRPQAPQLDGSLRGSTQTPSSW